MEIERRFLLLNDSWRSSIVRSDRFRQGYICTDPAHTVRVRIAGERAWLTLKGRGEGISHPEFEFAVPAGQAEAMLVEFCRGQLLAKTRHRVAHGGHQWEIDEFSGCLQGLVIAEIELKTADEVFERPAWLGREVSADPRYFNSCLVVRCDLTGLELV